jgi:hypothetical protein
MNFRAQPVSAETEQSRFTSGLAIVLYIVLYIVPAKLLLHLSIVARKQTLSSRDRKKKGKT